LTDTVADLVAQGVELAMRLGPVVDASLVGTPLSRVRYRVVASSAYLTRHGRPRARADLPACDCLGFPLPGLRTPWKFRDTAGQLETVDVKGWRALSTALALRRASLDGLGPALLAD
jgi:hypothetical protein